jgi:hypothetical protein
MMKSEKGYSGGSFFSEHFLFYRLEILSQVCRCLVSFGGILFQTLVDDSSELKRNVRMVMPDRLRGFMNNAI